MAKAKKDNNFIIINCPACKELHALNVDFNDRPRWNFDNNFENPTFSPSLLVRTGHHVNGGKKEDCELCNEEGWEESCNICHSFIRDGKIQFLNDCTHELAGKTVELPELKT